ncbi:MAG: tetratricopeptide repeat protein [Phycisphaerae bacterium]|nr:tetratricopeptide repeat protein [Phycisphaerae bacterium]
MPATEPTRALPPERLQELRACFAAERELRRGVCLLNAGRYEEAQSSFRRAQSLRPYEAPLDSVPKMLAACLVGRGKFAAAAEALSDPQEESPSNSRVIRHAYALWKSGGREESILALRGAVARDPESAELHFQLGTLLTELGDYEEAALRFEQVLSIHRDNADALVSLAMCRGVQNDPKAALASLQRAQQLRPGDTEIAMLLAQAASAVQQAGRPVHIHATMPAPETDDERTIESLSAITAGEPEFVDAFLSLSLEGVDEEVFSVLLKTLERALERQPEHAELHFHCAQVLRRLGREPEAIEAHERAVALNPRFTRALIELGRLYEKTNRADDAVARLKEALAAGAEYADVYYLLGNLYRDAGQEENARNAYARALSINANYRDAREALAALTA